MSPSRYPGWNVLGKWTSLDWDEPTRAVVRARLDDVPTIRFLSPHEASTLEAIVYCIVPQAAHTGISIVPWIDDKLERDLRDGYRYEDLPPLRKAWRAGIAGIDESAQLLYHRAFVELDNAERNDVLTRVQQGNAPGQTWTRLPAARFFRDVLCSTVVKLYYGHPQAWNEIGYSGPSSPRGHIRNWMGGVDPWDAPEEPHG
jgi:hypothetical protein